MRVLMRAKQKRSLKRRRFRIFAGIWYNIAALKTDSRWAFGAALTNKPTKTGRAAEAAIKAARPAPDYKQEMQLS